MHNRDLIAAIILGIIGLAAAVMLLALEKVVHLSPFAWNALFLGSAAILVLSVVNLVLLLIFSKFTSRAKMTPTLLINLGTCLIVAGFVWHFSFLTGGPASQSEGGKAPTVGLIWQPGQLQLHYMGHGGVLSIWGTVWVGNPGRLIDPQPRLIETGQYYYFISDQMEDNALKVIGQDGEQFQPFQVLLERDGHLFVAKFTLLMVTKSGKVTIHTQKMSVDEENWRG